jgi:hypothetical protein
MPWPSSRGGTRRSLRAAAARDAGHLARLGWFSCRCRRLHQRARAVCLPSLALLAVVCHTVLAADVTRCRRVRVHACVRAGTSPSRRCAPPARARPSPEGEDGPLAPFLAPDLDVAFLSAAPPWPRRGCLLRARSRREGSAVLLVGECTPRHQPPLQHTRVCARLRFPWPPPPMAPAWTLSWSPPCLFTANVRPKPESLTSTRARTQAHARARKFARLLTREDTRPPAANRLRADAAVPTPASTSPRRSPPFLGCVPSSPATRGDPLRLAKRGRLPRRREVSPPARPSRTVASLLDTTSSSLGQRWNRGVDLHTEDHMRVWP